jgi:hypothetical protein
MKYKELKEFINGLSPEQLEQDVKFYPDGAVEHIKTAEVLKEELVYDPEYPEEGCCLRSEWESETDIEFAIGLPIGTIMLYGE